jgi:hypothetical protein
LRRDVEGGVRRLKSVLRCLLQGGLRQSACGLQQRRFGVAVLLFFAAPLLGQTSPKTHAQAGAAAKACKLLSVPELEAYFGGKSIGVKGMDAENTSLCAYRVKDARHQATLEVHPPAPLEDSVPPKQRIDMVVQALKKDKAPESKFYGDIGCYRSNTPTGEKPLPSSVCFQSKGGYIALTIAGDDPGQTNLDAVKKLFDKIVARRK